MDCQIVGLTQDMNFDDNISQTFVVLQLPDGTRVRAAVDEKTAEKVVTLRVQAHGLPRVSTRTPAAVDEAPLAPAPPVERDPDAPIVFGGDVDAGGLDEDDPPEPAVEEEDAPESAEAADYDVPPAPPEVEAAHEAVMAEAHLGADGKPLRRQRRGKEPNEKKQARKKTGQATPGGAKRNLFRTASGELIAPAKNVPRTEYGYPMTPNGGVDPDALTGGGPVDDDGISSV